MKKIVLTLVAMLSMTFANAENENASNTLGVEAYDMNVNMRKLAVTLGMTFEQMEAVEDIHRTFCAEMMFATQYGKEERDARVNAAIKKDLGYMNYILNHDQYKKYVMLLNVTMANRGLK